MEVVRFRTYNIRKGHNGGLKLELHGMAQANVDLILMQETKTMDRIYAQESAGFRVVLLGNLSRHCGGVALF